MEWALLVFYLILIVIDSWVINTFGKLSAYKSQIEQVKITKITYVLPFLVGFALVYFLTQSVLSVSRIIGLVTKETGNELMIPLTCLGVVIGTIVVIFIYHLGKSSEIKRIQTQLNKSRAIKNTEPVIKCPRCGRFSRKSVAYIFCRWCGYEFSNQNIPFGPLEVPWYIYHRLRSRGKHFCPHCGKTECPYLDSIETAEKCLAEIIK